MNDRAVSEVVGYVIILGIVFTSIGIVYTNAVPVLEDSEEAEHLNNAERSFSVLKNNMDVLVEDDVERRGTQMRLTDGELRIETGRTEGGRNRSLIINVTETGTGNVVYQDSGFVAPIEYGISGRSVVYENGAVMRSEADATGMIDEPGWVVNDERVLINSVSTIYGAGTLGVQRRAGRGTALIRADRTGVEQVGSLNGCNGNDCDVNVTVITEHSTAWEQYFNASFSDVSGVDVDVTRVNDETVRMVVEGVPRVLYTRTNVELGVQ